MSILSDIFYNYLTGILNLNLKKKDEKFYYLSLIKEEKGWSIHGLWPQYSLKQYPTFCKKVTFDVKKLDNIIDELNTKWYSNKEKNEKFWQHEWEKHGSCMFIEINEFDYFNKTLELFNIAIQIDLPTEYYNAQTKQCLIPITTDFKFDIN